MTHTPFRHPCRQCGRPTMALGPCAVCMLPKPKERPLRVGARPCPFVSSWAPERGPCGRKRVNPDSLCCAEHHVRFVDMTEHVDRCLDCYEPSPPGSHWAWGIDDQSLCDGCAKQWRADGGECGPDVTGRAVA